MSIRLTKQLRDAIYRAICDDIPQVDLVARKTELQAKVVEQMGPECRAVYAKNPQALREERCDVLSPWYEGRHDVPADYTAVVVIGDVTPSALRKLCKQYATEDEARSVVRQKLIKTIDACTTVKALRTALPEFEKYLPSEEAQTKNLPAIANLVADLTKLGWPKTDK